MKVARQVHIGCQQAARKGRGCRPATSARLPMAPTTSQARNAQIVQRIADCNRSRKPRAVLLACGSLTPRPRGQIVDRLTAAATLHKHDQLFTGAYYALLLPADAPHARCATLAGIRRRLSARSGTCSDPAATRRRGADPRSTWSTRVFAWTPIRWRAADHSTRRTPAGPSNAASSQVEAATVA